MGFWTAAVLISACSQIDGRGSGIRLLAKDKIFALKASRGRNGQARESERRARALVIGPYSNGATSRRGEPLPLSPARREGRSPAARLSEALGLAQAIGLD